MNMVMMKRLFTVAALACLVGGTVLAQSSNPLVGTWKLNVAKSKGTPSTSGTTKIEAAGEGVKFTVDLAAPSGANHWVFTANFDGKDNPVTGNSPYGDAVAITRVDARTTTVANKQGGKVVSTQTMVVSVDGKTRTVTTKGVNAKGQPLDSVALYEKQ
jgi:hypothetical protein